MRRKYDFTERATSFIAVGVLGQVHGSHLPVSLSGALVVGGMAMLAVDRFLPRRQRRLEDLERAAGLDPVGEETWKL